MRAIVFSMMMCAAMSFVGTNVGAQEVTWQKAPNPVWQGKQDTAVFWYTLDAEGKLALTSDNQKWTIATQPQWTDYGGRLYKISGTELMMSSDTGKTWVKSPNRFWRGSDGMWYGFDDNWTLWTGGNGNDPPLGIVGVSNPYGGTDNYSGTNMNGETTGLNGNNTGVENNTKIANPNVTNTNSGGTVSGAQRNNEGNGRSSGNTGGGNTNNMPPK